MSKNYTNPETIGLHVGWRKDETTNSVAVPIHQTTSYEFNSSKHASNLSTWAIKNSSKAVEKRRFKTFLNAYLKKREKGHAKYLGFWSCYLGFS